MNTSAMPSADVRPGHPDPAAPGATWTAPTVTRKQVGYATWVCFFAWVFAVYDFILFGTLLPRLGEHFQWTAEQQARLNTWVTLGTVIVAFAIGPIADRLGRRKGIIIAVAGAALCSGLTALAGWVIGLSAGLGFVLLILVRSLAGLGYAEQSINATYLSELFALVYTDPASTRRRGFIYSSIRWCRAAGPWARCSRRRWWPCCTPWASAGSARVVAGCCPSCSPCSRPW